MSMPFKAYFTAVASALCCFSVSGQMFVDEAIPLGFLSPGTVDSYGGGLSVHDFNQDGLDDITMTVSFGNLKLYENNGDGFDLINSELFSPGWTKQILWVDHDNDGDLDLFLTTYGNSVKLYKNTGSSFEDVTVSSGLPTASAFRAGASFADYDKDGFLDVYICSYADSNFVPVTDLSFNKLYRNLGNGTFEDVTMASGIHSILANSFQSVWLDYNNDNWPDLYVINDRIYANTLHINNGDGTFTDVTESSGPVYPNQDVMSNSVADYDNDGDLDIFMTNTGSFNPPRPTLLAQNQGDGTFIESAGPSNLQFFQNSWGAVWIDADNDGWQDLFFTTADNTDNYFLINDEGSWFTQENDEIDIAANNPSWTVAKGDLNGDGYADMTVQSTAPNLPNILMNQNEGNHHIKVTLSGTVSNSMAISSWVHVYQGGAAYHQYTTCGNNYLSQDSQHLIFGLGENDDPIDSIKVQYLSGHIDRYFDLSVDSAYSFTEGETYTAEITSGGTTSFCEGDTLILEAGNHSGLLWNTSDTTSSIAITAPGVYSVTATNPFGITAVDTIEISVNPIPLVVFDTEPILCHGDSTGSILLTNLTGVQSESVLWSNGMDGNSISGLPTGDYAYTIVDVNGCEAQGEISLIEPPLIVVLATVNGASGTQNNGSLFINAFGGTPPYTNFLDSIEVGSFINNLAPGLYDLEVYDVNDCRDYQEVEVGLIVSIDQSNRAEFGVFPNPAHDKITIDTELKIMELELLDISGKRVWSTDEIQSKEFLIGQLDVGIYFVRIAFANGQAAVQKLSVVKN